MRETTGNAAVASWLRGYGDRENLWVSLRTLEHWIERAGN
jgi:hypothetical protein